MDPVDVHRGESPIVLGLPHTGTFVPEELFAKLTPRGQLLADTDWHIDDLYAGLLDGATTVRATFHRYVVDANRDPGGESLYPGQNTTGLVPLTDFDGEPLWTVPPTTAEQAKRCQQFHAAYHRALEEELRRVHEMHGVVLLYDCHSIRSEIPFLFEGRLPDFNIGTNGGSTCAPQIQTAVTEICERATDYTSVVNGRFQGGWTTRHYGRPSEGFHAIQMELAQSTYLQSETAPLDALPAMLDAMKADQLRGVLKEILQTLEQLIVAGGFDESALAN